MYAQDNSGTVAKCRFLVNNNLLTFEGQKLGLSLTFTLYI